MKEIKRASIRDIFDKMILLLNEVEQDIFDGTAADHVIYKGVEYTHNDFRNMERAVDRLNNYYKQTSKASARYTKINSDYHCTLKRYTYYLNKKEKKPKDFEMLEKYGKQLDEIREELKARKKKKKEEKIEKEENDIINGIFPDVK